MCTVHCSAEARAARSGRRNDNSGKPTQQEAAVRAPSSSPPFHLIICWNLDFLATHFCQRKKNVMKGLNEHPSIDELSEIFSKEIANLRYGRARMSHLLVFQRLQFNWKMRQMPRRWSYFHFLFQNSFHFLIKTVPRNPCNKLQSLAGQFNQVKPAKKKVVTEEIKAPSLPYTQILRMVKVTTSVDGLPSLVSSLCFTRLVIICQTCDLFF